MPQPPAYTIATDFSADEAGSIAGRSTVRTTNLDTELINIKAFVDQMRTNVALSQADDGSPKDDWVDLPSLADDVITWISTNGNGWYAVDTGTVNTMVVTLDPVPASLTNGMFVVTDIKLTNTATAVTLNVNGLGAKVVVTDGAGAVPSIGALTIGTFYGFQYDLSADKFQIVFSGDSIAHSSAASASAAAAAVSASSASTSASTATTQAGVATTQAGIATTQAGIATTKATAAAASAVDATTNGAAQVTLATAQVALATTQAGIATTQATSATSSASTATTQASTATTQAGISTTQASAAAASATAAAASADAFDDTYLGAKSSDPATDNDGDALNAGDLYFNTSTNVLMVYSGSVWQAAAVSAAGFVTLTGTETITNKTVKDDSFFIVDQADVSKKLAFQASGIATSTTRTVTMPDQNVDLTPNTGTYTSPGFAIAMAVAL